MKIKFQCDEHLLGVIPNPVPAIKAVPNYFKNIKPQADNSPSSGTVKRCVPFLDALSAGFIIPMWCDVYVLARGGEISIEFPVNFAQKKTLEPHSFDQIPKHPLSNKPYGNIPMKWVNPWVIETDSGVSCIFTSPLNHMETRFKILDGVVDTDTYYNNINLPFLWTGGDGEFFIPKGTPLVQIIPFRREEQDFSVSSIDDKKRNLVTATLGTRLKNAYRDDFSHRGRIRSNNEVKENAEGFEDLKQQESNLHHADSDIVLVDGEHNIKIESSSQNNIPEVEDTFVDYKNSGLTSVEILEVSADSSVEINRDKFLTTDSGE